LIGRKGTTRDTFLGNIPLDQRCGDTTPAIGVKHHSNTQGHGRTFAGSITRGFAAIEEPRVAVCLLPGTELAFEKEVEYDPALGSFLPNRKVRQKVARFRKTNSEQPHLHHDALEFPGGQMVLLTRLCEGQHATVLQLPASPRATNEAAEQKRVSLVP
jgi:hypothetical protein